MTEVWEAALETPTWRREPVWIHGDLDTRNLLVEQGRLSAGPREQAAIARAVLLEALTRDGSSTCNACVRRDTIVLRPGGLDKGAVPGAERF